MASSQEEKRFCRHRPVSCMSHNWLYIIFNSVFTVLGAFEEYYHLLVVWKEEGHV